MLAEREHQRYDMKMAYCLNIGELKTDLWMIDDETRCLCFLARELCCETYVTVVVKSGANFEWDAEKETERLLKTGGG